jgi:hypothetical protein
MEQGKSNAGAVVLAIIITAVVAGGGAYYFQKSITEKPAAESANEMETPVAKTTPVPQKSLAGYYKTRNQYLDSSMMKTPEESGFKELATVKIACPEDADGPCGFDLLILSKESLRSGEQEFYLAQAGGAGYSYYGPFTDDLERIVDESQTIESLKEIY